MKTRTMLLVIFLICLSAIAYAAPQVTDLSITNADPVYTTDNLICSFKVTSTGGEILRANITWKEDGIVKYEKQVGPVASGTTLTDTLSSSNTKKADSWICSVNAYNGSVYSGWSNSNAVIIANTNVALNDIPSLNQVEGEDYKELDLSAYAVDADSEDVISFTVTYEESSKVDCNIKADGKTLTYAPVVGFSGAATCRITASDGVYITPEKTVTINVASRNEALGIGSIPLINVVKTGGKVSDTFQINNAGNVDLSVSFSHTDLTNSADSASKILASAVSVNSGSSTSLTAGQSKDIKIEVTPNPSLATGTYIGDLTINYGTGRSETRAVSVTVREAGVYLTVPSEAYIGSSSGEGRNRTATGSFEIKNTGVSGDQAISGFKVRTNANSKYAINFSLDGSNYMPEISGFSLSPGQARTVYYEGSIPADMDSGTVNIGKIYVDNDKINKTVNLMINAKSMLILNDVNVDIDGKSDNSISLSGGDDIDVDAYPGSKIEFAIKVENLYNSPNKIDMEDVTITVTLMGIEEDDDDMEDDTSSFDLRYDSVSSYNYINFDIPYNVEDGTYDVRIEVEGTDEEYGATHSDSAIIQLNVERRSHDIIIMKANLGSTELECNGYTTLNVLVKNIGDDDEDEVVLTVRNTALGIDYNSGEFELVEDSDDDDSEFGKIFTIDLRDKNIAAGTYPILVNVYYSEDVLSDTKTVNLKVNSCGTASKPEEQKQTSNESVVLEKESEGIISSGGASAQGVTTESVEGSFLGGTGYIALLVLANLIIIVVAVVLVSKFLIKPKE